MHLPSGSMDLICFDGQVLTTFQSCLDFRSGTLPVAQDFEIKVRTRTANQSSIIMLERYTTNSSVSRNDELKSVFVREETNSSGLVGPLPSKILGRKAWKQEIVALY